MIAPASPAAVLIVGAGPTGLLLALELVRHGVRPRVVDAQAGPSPLSRAVVMHARTLELLERHELAASFLARGHQVRGLQLRVGGRPIATAPLVAGGEGRTPYPFVLTISQNQTETLLRDALASRGVAVEWNTCLTALTAPDGAPAVDVGLTRPASSAVERASFAYVVGCDGAHSAVRHALGTAFPGDAYAATFFVADTEIDHVLDPTLLYAGLHRDRFYALFPLVGGRTRVIGQLPAGLDPATAAMADVQPALEASEHLRVRDVSWFATYRVHHRVAASFQQERVLLAGDAGHIHSPVGGQGMNTGLGDAVNLGWKLAAAVLGTVPNPAALLATYEAERRPFAEQLVASTDRAFTFIVNPHPLAAGLRRFVVPYVLSAAFRLPGLVRRAFRTISQIGIAYPDSPLSFGRTAAARGGDRLPWFASDAFAPLRSPGWHLLSPGPLPPAARAWADQQGIAAAGGLTSSGTAPLYLVRPDGYVGLAAEWFDREIFGWYLTQWVDRTTEATRRPA